MSRPEHSFDHMQVAERDPAVCGEEGSTMYRGHCYCGFQALWTTNKDWAWEEIADHMMPFLMAELRKRTVQNQDEVT